MKELIELVEAWRRAPYVAHALATVLRIEGSGYRRMGARMLINPDGRVAGSVSGGCLEQSVILQAQAALADGCDQLLIFDTTGPKDLIFGSGLGCQGKIWIGVEILRPNRPWFLADVVAEICARREPRILVTRLRQPGGKLQFETAAFSDPTAADDPAVLPAAWHDAIGEVARSHQNHFVEQGVPDPALLEWLTPPVALVIFGDGPDVPPLVRLAREMGHHITVIGRRPELAHGAVLPKADRMVLARPADVAHRLRPDDWTVAVLMNHHYDTDREVLAALLPLGLPYLGLLGPRRRTERLLEDLRETGADLDETDLAALHAPAGLDLGADSPEQIALSIIAEIQATLAKRAGGKLKFRLSAIHGELAAQPREACAVRA